MAKPKLSSDWLAACAGCHMSLLDIDERIIQLAELVDIRATPVTDLKEPDESGVDVGILTGAINTTTNEEVALRMRERCKTLVALGDCAVFGGVVAMRNFFKLEDALRRAYIETESTDDAGTIPASPELGRPTRVRALIGCAGARTTPCSATSWARTRGSAGSCLRTSSSGTGSEV